jgi:hypothetical protein
VHEYSKLFNHLVQYALEQVDTDEKKKDRFMNALLTKLQERVALSMGGTFPDFVSNAIITDDKIRAHKEGKKRKVMATSSNSAPPKYRVVYPPPHPTYQSRQPYQQQQWAPRPPQRPHQQAAQKALPPPPTVLCLLAPLASGTASGHTCFNYSCSGHFARECPAPKKNPAQGPINPPPQGQQRMVATRKGCVNYTTMEEIPEGEQVLTCMFSLNGHPTIVLFDSGATHDFISKTCTQNAS